MKKEFPVVHAATFAARPDPCPTGRK